MKKIIYHHRTRNRGAEGVHISGIQNGFLKQGYTIYDISLTKTNTSEIEGPVHTQDHQSLLGIIADHLPNHLFKLLEVLYNVRSVLAGKRAIQRLSSMHDHPNLIYDRYAYFSFAMAWLSKKYMVPLILEVNTTCHDDDVRKIHFRWLAQKIERYIFRRSTLIVVVSTYLKNKIILHYGIPKDKILVTPNAVDPTKFTFENEPKQNHDKIQQARDFAKEHYVIGFAGIFVPWHGLDFLLEIYFELLDDIPAGTKLGLLLVGDGPSRQSIENKLASKGLHDSIFITGKVNHSSMKYFINCFDVAIMPDSNPFGSPMKIFEYMVMEKAVIAPAYAPITEIIEHQKNGYLFEPKNKEACKALIKYAVAHPGVSKTIGINAKQKILHSHTWQINVQHILSRLQHLTNDK